MVNAMDTIAWGRKGGGEEEEEEERSGGAVVVEALGQRGGRRRGRVLEKRRWTRELHANRLHAGRRRAGKGRDRANGWQNGRANGLLTAC